jgi:hypothetical protein
MELDGSHLHEGNEAFDIIYEDERFTVAASGYFDRPDMVAEIFAGVALEEALLALPPGATNQADGAIATVLQEFGCDCGVVARELEFGQAAVRP